MGREGVGPCALGECLLGRWPVSSLHTQGASSTTNCCFGQLANKVQATNLTERAGPAFGGWLVSLSG